MIRNRCFVSAPFAALTQVERDWNVARAVALGQLAIQAGLAPFVPHVAVAPLFPDGEASRGIAIAVDLAWVRGTASDPVGKFWLLQRDDRTVSEGCRLERAEWQNCRSGGNRGSQSGTWRDWRAEFHHHGMDGVWRDLLTMPSAEREAG